jgi:hypothetical protein
MKLKELDITGYRLNLRTAGIATLILAAILWLWSAFGDPSQGFDIFSSSNSTKTAIALTSDALLGPFPTSTMPTYTPTTIPTITSTLPSPTPSATRTPTPTVTFLPTATVRTREPGLITPGVWTSTPPSLRPTSTQARPTNTSFSPPNTPVPPTNIPPTQPPPPPTNPPIIIIPTIPLIQTLLPFP